MNKNSSEMFWTSWGIYERKQEILRKKNQVIISRNCPHCMVQMPFSSFKHIIKQLFARVWRTIKPSVCVITHNTNFLLDKSSLSCSTSFNNCWITLTKTFLLWSENVLNDNITNSGITFRKVIEYISAQIVLLAELGLFLPLLYIIMLLIWLYDCMSFNKNLQN